VGGRAEVGDHARAGGHLSKWTGMVSALTGSPLAVGLRAELKW
jgi:hypothetical protein